MNQKYVISRNDKKTELIIAEHAEVDKDTFALLCEETFTLADIQTAVEAGQEAVIASIRSKNMYPPHESSHRIADTVIAFVADESVNTVEVGFDDKTAIREAHEAEAALAQAAEGSADGEKTDIDGLLKDAPAGTDADKAVADKAPAKESAKDTTDEKKDK